MSRYLFVINAISMNFPHGIIYIKRSIWHLFGEKNKKLAGASSTSALLKHEESTMYLFLRVFDPEWSGKKEQIRFTYLNIRRFRWISFHGDDENGKLWQLYIHLDRPKTSRKLKFSVICHKTSLSKLRKKKSWVTWLLVEIPSRNKRSSQNNLKKFLINTNVKI